MIGQMSAVLGHDSELEGYTGPGTTWDNELNFVRNHALCAGTVSQPVDQQSSMLPLYHGRPFNDRSFNHKSFIISYIISKVLSSKIYVYHDDN